LRRLAEPSYGEPNIPALRQINLPQENVKRPQSGRALVLLDTFNLTQFLEALTARFTHFTPALERFSMI
jgi:hypothetical protein